MAKPIFHTANSCTRTWITLGDLLFISGDLCHIALNPKQAPVIMELEEGDRDYSNLKTEKDLGDKEATKNINRIMQNRVRHRPMLFH